ncbi:olfactory receptor 10Q1 [Alligator mississippiensis]|uniref:Olfactory receptor n=1 Tax=Alligator mississippiensis TaxID=8496 RepID=A0A151NVX3_ALLMI|nr:olfactory receptor 10Q1 [Alligator mississippiensis]KYO40739.1 olfactory receptor 10Q1-like [Alligator mississippiensis]
MHVDSNQTITTEFVFRPFSSVPTTRWLLFVLFFLLYIAIVVGNTSIVWVVHTDRALQSPMYFFLGNLALLEVCYTTTVVPQMLASILDPCTTISLAGCGTQMFLFLGLGGTDCFLLAIMAYDRYVAICQPLRYPLIMTQKLCLRLVVAALSLAFLLSLELTALIFAMPFCRRQINHFLCDVPPMLGLACADIHIHQTVLFTVSVTILTVPFLLICLSYAFIGTAILRICSAQGRRQAFSTCTSHLTVVLQQYGCCSLVYLRPKSKSSEDEDRQLALIYTFATPMLNPLIYSLRNKDIKGALRRAVRRTITSHPH